MDIKKLALETEAYVIERRRFYHQYPQLTHEEKETRDFIHKDLEALGITDIVDAPGEVYGLYADIHGAKPGKTVALRADIDALPVPEETGAPYASKYPGKMHACGHDCHIAMALGAAKILNSIKDELCGTVRMIFQPSEEDVSGANAMIANGCLEGVDAIYGAHIWGTVDAGKIDVTYGPRMAYAGFFDIIIEGVSAHGSAPNLGIDAITVGAAVINNVQQYVSRINNPLNPLVCTIGTIHGGTRFNVIPNKVVMGGTLRAFSAERHKEVLQRIVENTAAAFGAKGTLVYTDMIGPVHNNQKDLVELAQSAVGKICGPDAVTHIPAGLGSEDFASYVAKVPGVFAFIGSRNEEKGIIYTNHHEKYDVDESVLKNGAGVMAQFAFDFLNK